MNINRNFLNRQEAADYLGISTSTLANWACTKKFNLPYFLVGRSVRYLKSDIEAFIQNGKVV